jgi:hypothetical protein
VTVLVKIVIIIVMLVLIHLITVLNVLMFLEVPPQNVNALMDIMKIHPMENVLNVSMIVLVQFMIRV